MVHALCFDQAVVQLTEGYQKHRKLPKLLIDSLLATIHSSYVSLTVCRIQSIYELAPVCFSQIHPLTAK